MMQAAETGKSTFAVLSSDTKDSAHTILLYANHPTMEIASTSETESCEPLVPSARVTAMTEGLPVYAACVAISIISTTLMP